MIQALLSGRRSPRFPFSLDPHRVNLLLSTRWSSPRIVVRLGLCKRMLADQGVVELLLVVLH